MFRTKPVLTAAFSFLCLMFVSCSSTPENHSTQPTPVLSGPPNTTYPMPPRTATSFGEFGWVTQDQSGAGSSITRSKIADYKGKVLVLDLYATWCAPCRFSVPHLIDLQRRYESKGLVVVGLNVGGPDDRIKVKDFAKELGIQYSLGFPDQTLIDTLLSDDSSIPQTFIFNRRGAMVQRFIGYEQATTGPLLEQTIQAEIDKN
jgi:thiol-disulfide isomerase/thioredoxin